jgi:hypothetical protein
MNPELQRNLWLELTPRRVIMMAAVLGLVFLAFSLASGRSGLSTAAEYAFYGIVIVWGSRDAAQAVVGEIRDRTWDGQRLSALGAFQMTWGKLLGSTAYIWFGGVICLAALIAVAFVDHGPLQAFTDFCYFLSMGLMAHAVAFFASMIAVRRRQMHSRFDIFFYQLAGIVAAWWVWWVWQTAAPGGAMAPTQAVQIDHIGWWGFVFGARPFYLTSMVIFLLWAFVGCYRLMRTELMLHNGPSVWTGFVAFMAIYVAGFDSWLIPQPGTPTTEAIAMRLLVGAVTCALLTYLAVLFEPKDRVLYRWFGDALKGFRLGAIGSRLQAWMVAYIATVILAVAFILRMNMVGGPLEHSEQLVPLVTAALGFLTRDIFVFLAFALMPGQRRGDLAAVVVLIVLYGVAPWLAQSLGAAANAAAFFYPAPTTQPWFGPAIAWGEALIVLIGAVIAARSARPEAGPASRATARAAT